MLVEDILDAHAFSKDIYTIRTECSQFIQESFGLPVYRSLPSAYSSFHRVKVRQHKRSDNVSEAFNAAFRNEFYNIVPRGIFTQSVMMEHAEQTEPFYIFPINGYKYIYSKGVQNSNINFRDVMETLAHNTNDAFDITTDLIKYTYSKTRLVEGITTDSEIIFYGVPYFYAVRVDAVDSYTKLINR